ncbi:hypothetical protein WR25_13919 [Diploscapter pachys]|uniref:Uncharacterized protein n=1 Tax=Diploscapter pachys TaxID=2018661 RepID=A0A2A2K519_9BILA|nr:hypothetical protein WR25_13919 [Diploscapter pachys]
MLRSTRKRKVGYLFLPVRSDGVYGSGVEDTNRGVLGLVDPIVSAGICPAHQVRTVVEEICLVHPLLDRLCLLAQIDHNHPYHSRLKIKLVSLKEKLKSHLHNRCPSRRHSCRRTMDHLLVADQSLAFLLGLVYWGQSFVHVQMGRILIGLGPD